MTGADVLLIGGEPHEPEALPLIYEVPRASDLTWQQNHGQSCVWCGEGAGLAPLGGAGGWRPYGCAPCRQIRIAFLRAFVTWRRHLPECEQCSGTSGTWCRDGWYLALAHNEAHEAAGKPELVRCACGCALPLTSLRIRPYIENTVGRPRYSHTGYCLRPGRPVPAEEVEQR
ncbi:hypothetical protein ACIQPR_18100 [Streptomyces sp. NPDC091280]|uniref:hypothetical protein n=1 Tax=Streptomyces sp. NPDC091280 TaxID=3365984 RepID=UPI00382BCE40